MWLEIKSMIQIEVGNNGPPYTCVILMDVYRITK